MKLTSIVPEHSSIGVSLNQPIVMNFDKPVDHDTFSQSCIALRDDEGSAVAITLVWSNDNTTLTVGHDELLKATTQYTFTFTRLNLMIGAVVKSVYGDELENDVIIKFLTSSTVKSSTSIPTENPYLDPRFSPIDESLSVSDWNPRYTPVLNGRLEIVFSKELDEMQNFNELTTILVENPYGIIDSDMMFAATPYGNVLQIIFLSQLSENSAIIVELSPDIKSSDGSTLGSSTTMNFFTGIKPAYVSLPYIKSQVGPLEKLLAQNTIYISILEAIRDVEDITAKVLIGSNAKITGPERQYINARTLEIICERLAMEAAAASNDIMIGNLSVKSQTNRIVALLEHFKREREKRLEELEKQVSRSAGYVANARRGGSSPRFFERNWRTDGRDYR
ncbi:MAG TPA: Ig-like domain-containing protein [Mesotoga sp.]|nr:Ig-like domain-containing protein [Mesotoga sp.]